MSCREGREESLQPRPTLGQILEAKFDNIRIETLMIILLFLEYTQAFYWFRLLRILDNFICTCV
jgi:hypothetical protein